MNFHANILRGKPQSRRCDPSKSHLRGKSRSYDIAIAARRRLLNFYDQFHEFAAYISPESRSPPRLFPRTPPGQAMAVSRGSPRASPLAPTYAPSHALYAISCHLMYTHTPMVIEKCHNTPSTNPLHVFAFQVGRSVWLNKDYCLNTSSSSKCFR